jgi:hypothetical protein
LDFNIGLTRYILCIIIASLSKFNNSFSSQISSCPLLSIKIFIQVPSIILEKYPNRSLETFEYSRSIFFRWVDGTIYAQVVDRELQRAYDLPTYEYYMFAAFE